MRQLTCSHATKQQKGTYTFATARTFRQKGTWTFKIDPNGPEFEV